MHLVQFCKRVSFQHCYSGNALTQDVHNLMNVVHLTSCFQQGFDRPVWTLDGFGQLVDILRLNYCFQIVFEYFGKVVWILFSIGSRLQNCRRTLKLGTSEVFQDLLPIWRIFKSTKIGFQFATEYLQCSTLSNPVGTHQA